MSGRRDARPPAAAQRPQAAALPGPGDAVGHAALLHAGPGLRQSGGRPPADGLRGGGLQGVAARGHGPAGETSAADGDQRHSRDVPRGHWEYYARDLLLPPRGTG